MINLKYLPATKFYTKMNGKVMIKYLSFTILLAMYCSCNTPGDKRINLFGHEYEFNQDLEDFIEEHKNADYDDSDNDDTLNVHLGSVLVNDTLNINDLTAVFFNKRLAYIYYFFYYVDRNASLEKVVSPIKLNLAAKSIIESYFPNAHKVRSYIETDLSGTNESIIYTDDIKGVNIHLSYSTDSLANHYDLCMLKISSN